MNILILTSSRSGSTILQQTLGIFMSKKGFDKPVINISSLVDGTLKLVHSDVLNQTILQGVWVDAVPTYRQSVTEIIDALKSANHYMIARLEEEDVTRLGWTRGDELLLYKYLNDNFYIIESGRRNLLENVLSKATRYNKSLSELNQPQKRTIAKETVIKLCNQYKNFKSWCDQFFHVQSYCYYEDCSHTLGSLEEYILNLDFMQDNPNGTWKDMFGQTFAEFNVYHNLIRPRENVSQERNIKYNVNASLPIVREQYLTLKGSDWPDIDIIHEYQELPELIIQDIKNIDHALAPTIISVSPIGSEFLTNNRRIYLHTIAQFQTLGGTGLMVENSITIKRQTLIQKLRHIKNINEVIGWYNSWVKINKFGEVYTYDELIKLAAIEEKVSEDIMQKSINTRLSKSDIKPVPLLTLLTNPTETIPQ